MSKHPFDYYIRPNGTIVMTFDVFKELSHTAVCKALGIKIKNNG